jgi:hypothetical protein
MNFGSPLSFFSHLLQTFMRTSPALGGETWTSSITNGLLGSQAIAALQVITLQVRKEIINNIIYGATQILTWPLVVIY